MAGLWSAAAMAKAATPPSAVSADVDPGSLLNKLVRRITMGATVEEINLAKTLGYTGYLEYHLNYAAIDDSATDARIATLTTLTQDPVVLYTLPVTQVVNELTEAVIIRAWMSKRQLFERMVEFWTDHFNIDITKEQDTFLKTPDDRNVIRPHALGFFPAMLSASAHSPAMLAYLDNTTSVVGNPNENYAREIMELHSLGVDGGYTQEDVKEVARCFTGWTLWARTGSGDLAGKFRFDASKHDNGQKVVLGNIIPAGGGQQDGETVIQILANHPSTAKYIAKKLCHWFLGDGVPQSLIDGVASVYTSTGGDIKAMIRQMLTPNALADSAPKFKRPFHLFISALRVLPTTITATTNFRTQLQNAGQRPFYWTTPDGYPDYTDFWVGFTLPRWNYGASLANGNISGVVIDSTVFFSGLTTAQQMADQINQVMFAGELPLNEKNRIRDYMLPDAPSTQRKKDAIGLAISTPSFQWY